MSRNVELVAVVTGGSLGIGKGLLAHSLKRGATVYVAGRSQSGGIHASPGGTLSATLGIKPEPKREEWLAALDKMQSLKPRIVVAGHKNPKNDDDGSRVIGQTRQYILDFQELVKEVTSQKELYDKMLARYPDWLNRGALWSSVTATKK